MHSEEIDYAALKEPLQMLLHLSFFFFFKLMFLLIEEKSHRIKWIRKEYCKLMNRSFLCLRSVSVPWDLFDIAKLAPVEVALSSALLSKNKGYWQNQNKLLSWGDVHKYKERGIRLIVAILNVFIMDIWLKLV